MLNLKNILAVLALTLGCAGAADSTDLQGEAFERPAQVENPPAAHAEPEVPLCEGAHEPEPADCQTLVYGTHGYCNRWLPCEPPAPARNTCGLKNPESCPACPGNEIVQVDADLVAVPGPDGLCGKLVPIAAPESPAAASEAFAAPELAPEVVELVAEPPVVTFSISGEDSYNARFPLPLLHEGLVSALARWSSATCRELEMVPEGGQHTVSWGDATTVQAGRLGQTTGSWDAALIQAKKVTKGATPIILAHEIAHLLARSNDHAEDGVYSDDPFSAGKDVITAADLTKVCSSFECVCFKPEE